MRRSTQWLWLQTETNNTDEDESRVAARLESAMKRKALLSCGIYLEDLLFSPPLFQAQERKLKLEEKRKKLAAAAALLEERNADGLVTRLETPVFSFPSRTVSASSAALFALRVCVFLFLPAAITPCHKLAIIIALPSEPSSLLKVVALSHAETINKMIGHFCCSTIVNIEPQPF